MRGPPPIAPRPVPRPPQRSAPALPPASSDAPPVVLEANTRKPLASLPDLSDGDLARLALAKVASLDVYHERLDERSRQETERQERQHRELMTEVHELRAIIGRTPNPDDRRDHGEGLLGVLGRSPNPMVKGDLGSGLRGKVAQLMNADRLSIEHSSRRGAATGAGVGSFLAFITVAAWFLERC